MMIPFRKYRRLLLPALLLWASAAAAQEMPSAPLTADPGRAIYYQKAVADAATGQQRTTALALPFFDDFSTPLEGIPKVQNWTLRGGAFVSNRLAVLPLTRGAATLDGLRANGQSYSGAINSVYGSLDSLTSQPIDLSGLSTSSQVFLTFAWQAGSVVNAPTPNGNSTPVRLQLFVKTSTGAWEQKWMMNSTGRRTSFRQQVIDLNEPRYLHGDFQFRFVATGNGSSNSDNWSVDYVLLNSGRVFNTIYTDTVFTDVATGAGLFGGNPSGGLRSPLRRFAAMPVWQFNAVSPAGSELNPNLGVNLTNLNPILPLPIDITGTVQVLPAGPLLGTWFQSSRLLPRNTRQEPATSSAASVALPLTATPKTLRYTLALNSRETNPRTLPNDTISRDVELANYYAYDDGTAEASSNLVPFTTGQQGALAYRFDLNQPDYVRGLRLYPVFPGSVSVGGTTTPDNAARTITISVWDDAAGLPAATARASKTVTIPAAAAIPAAWQYYQADFDLPVPVSGTFYVGFSQPSVGRFLPYGLDYNSSPPPGYSLKRENTGAWSSFEFLIPGTTQRGGALMMRPVMTNNVVTAATAAHEATAYSIYPNPTRGTVTVAGPAFARASVLDVLGRTVWTQPAAQAGQATLPLPALPGGVYTVRLLLADGYTVARRLTVE